MSIDGAMKTVWKGEIVGNQSVSTVYRRMTILAPGCAHIALAGQFVHVLGRDENFFDPLLRRAFSIMKIEGDFFVILFRVNGKGTQALAQRRVGDKVDFLGPLGQPFAPAPQDVLMVGGGVGVPPMVMLALQLRGQTAKRNIHMIIGAQTGEDVLCLDEFRLCDVEVDIVTDDGSVGEKGRVTLLLERHLMTHTSQNVMSDPGMSDQGANTRIDDSRLLQDDLMVYACGPWNMLRAVAALCARYNVLCQVSMEENMPCGIGVCNGCVVETVVADNQYSIYRRTCVEGPPMWAHEIKW